MKANFKNHKHTWIVSSIAIVLAIITIVLLPQNKGYSMFFTSVAAGHILILLIGLFTGWIVIPQSFINKIIKKKSVEGFDFGWSPKWLYSFVFAALLTLIIAVYIYYSLEGSPIFQLVCYTLLLLLATNFFIGYIILRSSKRQTQLTLPMVQLLPNESGKVLDAGCGAGRTTVALAKGMPEVNIIALDRFDADYISNGGVELLKRNIQYANAENRVKYEKGDITATKFANEEFDAIISSFMFDHLGANKQKALMESFRILKSGGRFLLIIATRGFTTFGIANVLSLLFPTRANWIKWIEQTGFNMVSDGIINEGSYFCFEKPSR